MTRAPNPILVEVMRGRTVESRHRGRFAVVDPMGGVVDRAGDIEEPVFPRSAIKSIQALPLIETGAGDAFGISPAELALACSSHNGEAMHTGVVLAWLERAGLAESDLECGPHAPGHAATAEILVREGRAATRVHNNCSGKHTGFLTVARHVGQPTAGYSGAEHSVQRMVVDVLRELTDADPAAAPVGIDGCGVPTWGLPLRGLALANARFADPSRLTAKRRDAILRIRAAIAEHPLLVAGTGRMCSAVIAATKGAVLVKTGAEGVFTALAPAKGLGFALKIDDGASRASEVAILALLHRHGAIDDEAMKRLASFAQPTLTNTQARAVGAIRAVDAIAG
jgi:L-asparaginase II